MKERENAVCRGDFGKKRAAMDACHPNVPCCSVQVCSPWSVYLSQCQHSLVSGLIGPRQREIIHLSLHLRPRKPFITRPETSINYSDGRKSEERQIHLDLIGKQVCSRPLSRFPLRWSCRDNGAREGEGRLREIADEVMERSTDGRTNGGIFMVIRSKTRKVPQQRRERLICQVSCCNLEPQREPSHDGKNLGWLGLKMQISLDPIAFSDSTVALCCTSHTSGITSISPRLSINSHQWHNRILFL